MLSSLNSYKSFPRGIDFLHKAVDSPAHRTGFDFKFPAAGPDKACGIFHPASRKRAVMKNEQGNREEREQIC